ncbi:MBL fold metallo-hydrolase [Berryella wangjianweii]|uniref:MBL fold metallo-hydrolase n=1 Tax=Berryella wangjianweii TaxID=2734634 RepID=A0A6M8IX41_9ACTN|nr:MBL fold metallo-hydrolase [Berryella wangjianweii]NPD32099.1 MBL fold metallo-hydrolase [Eggerthellaceae bacterium zg-997]QKF07325.1 MBL fold metallo-hydrolase [Berryella wangjianweii]
MAYRMEGGCLNVRFEVLGPIDNNVYVIDDGAQAIVVDPTFSADAIEAVLGGMPVSAIVLTHRHWDHTDAAAELRRRTGATVIAHELDAPYITGEKHVLGEDDHDAQPCPVDHVVRHGDVVQIASMPWKVLHTPGHTPGSMCLYIDPRFGCHPQGDPLLISGDTLFFGTIGRTDFVGGSLADMKRSLKRLAILRDSTIVLPGHGDLTTIGDERVRVFAHYADDEPDFGCDDDRIVTV